MPSRPSRHQGQREITFFSNIDNRQLLIGNHGVIGHKRAPFVDHPRKMQPLLAHALSDFASSLLATDFLVMTKRKNQLT